MACARDHERQRAGTLRPLARQQLHHRACKLAGHVDREHPLPPDKDGLPRTRGPWFRRCQGVKMWRGAWSHLAARQESTYVIEPTRQLPAQGAGVGQVNIL